MRALLLASSLLAVTNAVAQEGSTASAVAPVIALYACDTGKTVTATYDDTGEAPQVVLRIGEKDYTLQAVPSGSGVRYATERGPMQGQLFTWWIKGDEAVWLESPIGGVVKPEEEKLVATCKKSSSPPQ